MIVIGQVDLMIVPIASKSSRYLHINCKKIKVKASNQPKPRIAFLVLIKTAFCAIHMKHDSYEFHTVFSCEFHVK